MTAIAAANGFNLECDFNAEFWQYMPGESCTVRNLVIQQPHQSVTTVNNRPNSGVQTKKVKYLRINSQVVNYMPVGLEKFFPNILEVEVSKSSLKSIHKQDFAQFKNLRMIDLSRNDLQILESDLFSSNPNLHDLNVSRNSLEVVGDDLLKPLKNLFTIDFSDNPCISFKATGEVEIQELENRLKAKCSPTSRLEIFLSAIFVFSVLVVAGWGIHCMVRKCRN